MDHQSTQISSQNSLTSSTIEVSLPDPNGSGKLRTVTIDNSIPAAKNKQFMAAFSLMLLAGSGRSEYTNACELPMLKEALDRNEVTPKEAYDAFWKAYGDPYVGKGGIQFRHLWKHIEKARYGEEGKLFTYEEMLNYCDRNSCSTDVFTMISDETDSQDRPKWALK